MKYTPQELLQFVKKENLEDQLKNAIGNNGRDYHLYPTTGELKSVNGEAVYDFQPEGIVEPILLKSYCTPEQIEILRTNPQSIRSALTFHAGNIGFVVTFSPDKEENEQEAEFWDHVYLDLFRTLEMDTHGKVRRFIEDAGGQISTRNPVDGAGQSNNTGRQNDGGVQVFRPTAPMPQNKIVR